MTIRSRLALSYGAGVIVTLSIVGLFVWWQMGSALQDALVNTLEIRAAGVLTSLENAGQAGVQETDQTAPGVFVALFSAGGSLLDASATAPEGVLPTNGVIDTGGRHYLIRSQTAPDGTIVVTGADLRGISDAQAALARLLLGVGLSVGGVSLVGGWLLAGRALQPVDRLVTDAATIGPSDLTRRLAPAARMDELGRLTVTLNGMLDRLAESVERQRMFIALASHELRTPLAALRAELEIVERDGANLRDYRQAVHRAHGDTIRLTSLVASLLELAATSEEAQTSARAPVGLRQLVEAVTRGLDPLTREHGVVVVLDVSEEVVWVDRTRLEHALGNLLSNAVIHGGPGRAVEIHGRVDGGSGQRTLLVEVLDRGPGLGDNPPDQLFAPFRRGSQVSAPGSGLGLATVAAAVRIHGGCFSAGNREGGGARFWFSVPCEGTQSDSIGGVANESTPTSLPDGSVRGGDPAVRPQEA